MFSMFFSPWNSKDTEQAIPLFKKSSKQEVIYVADDLLIKNPNIFQCTPSEVVKKLGIPEWSEVPLISAKLADKFGISREPDQILKKFLKKQKMELVDPSSVCLVYMGEKHGYGLFALKPIKRGTAIFYGGVQMDKSEVFERLEKSAKPLSKTIVPNPDDENVLCTYGEEVHGLGVFLQCLPNAEIDHSQFATQNVYLHLMQYDENVYFPILITERNLSPGEILGWQYSNDESDKKEFNSEKEEVVRTKSLPSNQYFENLGIKQSYFFRNGKVIPFENTCRFSAIDVHIIKYYISNLSNPRNMSALIQGLMVFHKDFLYTLTRKEQQQLYSYRNCFGNILDDSEEMEQISERMKKRAPRLDISADMVDVLIAWPDNALRFLLNGFIIPEPTFNYEQYYVPIVKERFETVKSDILSNYQIGSVETAHSLYRQGINKYNAATQSDAAEETRKLFSDAISLLQEALNIFRIVAERDGCPLVKCPDNNCCLVITREVALCYWTLARSYFQIEMFVEAQFFFERCLFLVETDEKDIIKMSKTPKEIKDQLKLCEEQIVAGLNIKIVPYSPPEDISLGDSPGSNKVESNVSNRCQIS